MFNVTNPRALTLVLVTSDAGRPSGAVPRL